MDQQLFKGFTYDTDEGEWRGFWKGSQFAQHLVRPRKWDEPLSEEENQRMMANADEYLARGKQKAIELHGPAAAQLFEMMEAMSAQARAGKSLFGEEMDEVEEEDRLSPEEEARRAKEEAARNEEEQQRSKGFLPILVHAPKNAEPTPMQEAALRDLLTNDKKIARQVMAALGESYAQYEDRKISPKELAEECQLLHATVEQEHCEGTSYIVITVECTWEGEHGMYVVYHPAKGAHWGTHDSLDELLESDEPVPDDEDDFEQPGNSELWMAVGQKDEARVKKLLAEGHDINAVGDLPPPLFMAVMQSDVDVVKRLLAIGADPKLKDAAENKTPLQMAKQMLRMFTPSPDNLMAKMMALAQQVRGKEFGNEEAKLKEIVSLLEAAEAK